MSAATPTPGSPTTRLTSLDAYRGLVMFLMGVELLALEEVALNFPNSAFWRFVGFHADHVAWTGCSLHDLIHPSFTFMVGVALPFSLASRLAKGQPKSTLVRHAIWRSLALIFLGVFVHSLGRSITNWTFEDTLTQMGLSYPIVFMLAFARDRTRWISIAVILFAYWMLFALWPLPPPDFNDVAVNIPVDWPHHAQGFFAHWNLNRNPAWEFDTWLLNLFPRHRPFVGYIGGYNTLNFIPSTANMILGLIAGTWLREAARSGEARTVIVKLIRTGLLWIALGWSLQMFGICPIIKKIWTPAWSLFSGGWSCLIMAGIYYIMDVKRYQRWAFPFVVIGMNSIAMYLLFHTIDEFIAETLEQHLGQKLFLIMGEPFQPMLLGAGTLLVLWLILLWMHKRRLYLKV